MGQVEIWIRLSLSCRREKVEVRAVEKEKTNLAVKP
jgi:hypothetical protein